MMNAISSKGYFKPVLNLFTSCSVPNFVVCGMAVLGIFSLYLSYQGRTSAKNLVNICEKNLQLNTELQVQNQKLEEANRKLKNNFKTLNSLFVEATHAINNNARLPLIYNMSSAQTFFAVLTNKLPITPPPSDPDQHFDPRTVFQLESVE